MKRWTHTIPPVRSVRLPQPGLEPLRGTQWAVVTRALTYAGRIAYMITETRTDVTYPRTVAAGLQQTKGLFRTAEALVMEIPDASPLHDGGHGSEFDTWFRDHLEHHPCGYTDDECKRRALFVSEYLERRRIEYWNEFYGDWRLDKWWPQPNKHRLGDARKAVIDAGGEPRALSTYRRHWMVGTAFFQGGKFHWVQGKCFSWHFNRLSEKYAGGGGVPAQQNPVSLPAEERMALMNEVHAAPMKVLRTGVRRAHARGMSAEEIASTIGESLGKVRYLITDDMQQWTSFLRGGSDNTGGS